MSKGLVARALEATRWPRVEQAAPVGPRKQRRRREVARGRSTALGGRERIGVDGADGWTGHEERGRAGGRGEGARV